MNDHRDQVHPDVIAAGIAREELYDTLGRLRERLDYAHRIDVGVDRAKARLIEQKRRNPLAFGLGVVAVAVGAGLVVWGIASKIAKR